MFSLYKHISVLSLQAESLGEYSLLLKKFRVFDDYLCYVNVACSVKGLFREVGMNIKPKN
jgi:hypothetical protein